MSRAEQPPEQWSDVSPFMTLYRAVLEEHAPNRYDLMAFSVQNAFVDVKYDGLRRSTMLEF